MERTKKHDFDIIGIGIGISRMLIVGIGAFISWWLANYFQPLQTSVHQLAINTAGIVEKLENLDTTTSKLEENQSSIILLVNSNTKGLESHEKEIVSLRESNNSIKSDVNDLKVRVYYLERNK